MNKTTTHLILALLLAAVLPGTVLAQVAAGRYTAVPAGVSAKLGLAGVPMRSLPGMQPEEIDLAIAQTNKHGRYIYGQLLGAQTDLVAAMHWQATGTSGLLGRYAITSTDAQGLGIYLAQVQLPADALLYLYTANGTSAVGPYTAADVHGGILATPALPSDTVVVELLLANAADKAGISMQLDQVVHAFRGVKPRMQYKDFGESGSCMVNVACSEASGWEGPVRAVVRMSIPDNFGFVGYCSGTLVNNTAQDKTALLLTAEHCLHANNSGSTLISAARISQIVFHFNYQSATCANPLLDPLTLANSLTGASLVAWSHDQGGDTGSDFSLLELNDDVPALFNAYYAGWNSANFAPQDGVGVHHPSGDMKKISTFNTTAVSTSSGGTVANTHWEIKWAGTSNGHGVTEPGSSGSGIFNETLQLVGTLTGGGSACNSQTDADFYGKFSYHWASNGTAADHRLKPWLDPNNTGAESLPGLEGGIVAVDAALPAATLALYPNPASGACTLTCADAAQAGATCSLTDAAGRSIALAPWPAGARQHTIQLPTAAGLYLVQLQLPGGAIFTARMLVR